VAIYLGRKAADLHLKEVAAGCGTTYAGVSDQF
jgi:hypothetical protein